MEMKFQKSVIVAGIISLASVVLMLVPFCLNLENAQKEILENYFSIPFWILISVVIVFIAGNILYALGKGEGKSWKANLLSSFAATAMIVIGVFAIYSEVINPLRDIPYLQNPNRVYLEQVGFYYNNTGDTPSIQLEGRDIAGERESYTISHETYEQGESLCEQLEKMGDSHMVVANIEYLPYSETVLKVDMRIEER